MAIIDRTGASALIPNEQATEILAHLPEGSNVMRLGRRLPDMSSATRTQPVMSALPTAYFVDEVTQTHEDDPETGSYKQTTHAEWDGVTMTVGEIACIVPIPESVLEDSSYDIWGEIKPFIVEAIGVLFDGQALYGIAGAVPGWPAGVVAGAPPAHVLAEGAIGPDLYGDLLGDGGLVSILENDGYMVNGHVAHLSMRGKLRDVRSTDGLPIFGRSMQDRTRYELDGVGIDFPTTGIVDPAQSLLIAGDWTKLVYAIRRDITYKMLTEGVIQDPATGAIVYNLAQQDMVALRVTMRMAWQLANPINRVNTNSATRYPFAVLTA